MIVFFLDKDNDANHDKDYDGNVRPLSLISTYGYFFTKKFFANTKSKLISLGLIVNLSAWLALSFVFSEADRSRNPFISLRRLRCQLGYSSAFKQLALKIS